MGVRLRDPSPCRQIRRHAGGEGPPEEERARLKLKVDDPTTRPQAPVQRPDNVSDISSRRALLADRLTHVASDSRRSVLL